MPTPEYAREHASRYEIRVKGALDARWSTWFAGLEICHRAPSETTLTGSLRDQAELHGVLARVRDLGLPLVEVRCLDPDPVIDSVDSSREKQMSLTMPTAQRIAGRTGDWSLATRATQFAAIYLQVLVVGAFWGSWIGLSRFMHTLTPATFVEVGHAMMDGYGPIMSMLMPAALLATLVAGILAYRRKPLAGFLTLAGFLCVAGATAITLIVNVPIDEIMAGWTVTTLPADWMQIRDRWEWYHTARTFVTLGGLAATLAGSLLPAGRAEE